MRSINPAIEEIIETHEEHDEAAVDVRLNVTWDRFELWYRMPISRREELLTAAVDMLRERSGEYATLMTEEMGKPVEQAASKVKKYVWVCDYYAEHVSELLQDGCIGTVPGPKTYISYGPVGPMLAMISWDFPFQQMFRFAAPHIAAGNIAVLKHTPNISGCAGAVTSVFEWAGCPDDVFTSLRIPAKRVTSVIEDGQVRGVNLTRSIRAERAVAGTSDRKLRPAALKFGGSNPSVVLDDTPLEAIAKRAAWAQTQDNGQSCTATERFLVHEAVCDEFVERFTEETCVLTVGDPTDSGTDMGPQARVDLMETLHEQITASVEAGAALRLGDEPLDRPDHYYPPTVLTGVSEDAPARVEELFSPATTVIRVEGEAETVHVTNDMLHGLNASIRTANAERGEAFTIKFIADNIAVNHVIASDLQILFSRAKDSGYGTELSRHGIRGFVNTGMVWVEDAPAGE